MVLIVHHSLQGTLFYSLWCTPSFFSFLKKFLLDLDVQKSTTQHHLLCLLIPLKLFSCVVFRNKYEHIIVVGVQINLPNFQQLHYQTYKRYMSINNTLPCCEEEELSKSTGPGAGGDGWWWMTRIACRTLSKYSCQGQTSRKTVLHVYM